MNPSIYFTILILLSLSINYILCESNVNNDINQDDVDIKLNDLNFDKIVNNKDILYFIKF